jgi:hypothetical protein
MRLRLTLSASCPAHGCRYLWAAATFPGFHDEGSSDVSGNHTDARTDDIAVTTGRAHRRRVIRAITATGAPLIEYRATLSSTFLVPAEFAASLRALLTRR